MDFTSPKAILAYFAAGAALAVLFLVLDAPGGFFVCLFLPFAVTGLALLAKRRDNGDE